MVADRDRLLRRAAEAQRSSKRVELRGAFDPGSDTDWATLVTDLAAMANSGGGVIVLGGPARVDEESIHEQLARHVDPEFESFELHDVVRDGTATTAIVVESAPGTPLVTEDGRHLYFRHGARSEPASGEDVRDFIRRQLETTRKQWLSNIRQVMRAPDGAEVAVVETAERDEEGRPTLIRLTTDPNAPLYGQLDPDRSHPYRQKEVIREVNARLDGPTVNAFDVLSVRRVHAITEESRPEFVHVPKFGSPQYSDAFVDWLVEQQANDSEFFRKAKTAYLATRRRRRRA